MADLVLRFVVAALWAGHTLAQYTNLTTGNYTRLVLSTRSSPSSQVDSGSTTGLGGYVALGLGYTRAITAGNTSIFVPSSPSSTSASGSPPSSKIHTTLSSNATTSFSAPIASLGTVSIGNFSVNPSYAGDCWAQWSEYDDLMAPTLLSTMTTTFTWTAIYEVQSELPIPILSTWTQTISDEPYAAETDLSTLTVSSVWVESTDGAYTSVLPTVITTAAYPNATEPSCALPSVIPQCQSQWISWAASQSMISTQPPICTQASVAGNMCSALQASYVTAQGLYDLLNTTSSAWDGSSQLAPGCTVGCQQCRITGTSVQLLYWPPTTSNGSNLTMTKTGLNPVTATGFGTTFTSPTVYISFDTLYASDSCSGIGSTYYNQLVALPNSKELSREYGRTLGGQLPSASFNFTDLYVKPVPTSIYNSQPYCHSVYSQEHREMNQENGWEFFNCWHGAADYRPILAIPTVVRDLDPAWASCIGGVNGVYDPPKALQPVGVAASATADPYTILTTTAERASSLGQPGPLRTDVPAVSKVTALPEIVSAEPSTQGAVPTAAPYPEDPTDPATDGVGAGAPSSAASTGGDPAAYSSVNSIAVTGPGADGTASVADPDSSPPGVDDPGSTPIVGGTDSEAPSYIGGSDQTVNALSVLSAAQDPPGTNALQTAAEEDPGNSANAGQAGQAANGATATSSSMIGDPGLNTASVYNAGATATNPIGVLPATAFEGPGAAFQVGDQMVTAVTLSGTMVLAEAGSTTTSPFGSEATLDGHVVYAADGGSSTVVDGTSAVAVTPSGAFAPESSDVAAVWTARNGRTFSAFFEHGSVVVIDGGTSVTLVEGATTTLDREIVSAGSTGGFVAVDESKTIPITGAGVIKPISTDAAAVWTGSNGRPFSAF